LLLFAHSDLPSLPHVDLLCPFKYIIFIPLLYIFPPRLDLFLPSHSLLSTFVFYTHTHTHTHTLYTHTYTIHRHAHTMHTHSIHIQTYTINHTHTTHTLYTHIHPLYTNIQTHTLNHTLYIYIYIYIYIHTHIYHITFMHTPFTFWFWIKYSVIKPTQERLSSAHSSRVQSLMMEKYGRKNLKQIILCPELGRVE